MLRQVQDRLPEMVEMLGVLVNMESPSDSKPHVDSLIAHLAQLAAHRGGEAEVIKLADRGNHLRVEWGQGTEQLLILCHIDTVWDVGETKKRPFRVEGDKAFGPGAFDMKCGTVMTMFAMEHLVKMGWPLGKRVVALFNSDEEIGSTTSREMIEEEARKSKAVLVLEPAIAPKGSLKTARKGVGRFDLKVEGVAAHSGSAPQNGASAVQELAHQVLWLHSLTDYDKGTTVNVGVVKGGTRSNVVAAEAHAQIDLRAVTVAEAERIVPLILGTQAETPGTKVTVTGGLNRPPMERTEAIVAMYRTAERIADELGIDISEGMTGGGSDGNFTAAMGIPTIDGLGAVGDGAHAAHEFLYISKMAERTALLIRLLEELGK
ncbi:MAG TPA: M20 family metallopeptidase [Bacillota bacterium]|nr:M20 family metallopeptidase [Bacillota bacterium]